MKIPAALAAALLLAGCATVPKPVFNEAMSEEELVNTLRQTAMDISHFSAEGTITVNSPSVNQSAGIEVSARGTDSVKLSVYGPFGITVGSGLLTRNEFAAYNALNNTLYRGSPEKQMRSLPFINDIPVELFAGALQGIHTVHAARGIDSFSVQAGRKYFFTRSYDDGSFDKFVFSDEYRRITRCTRYNRDGTPLWIVRYYYKQEGNGAVLPEQVEVEIPRRELTVTIEYGSASYTAPPAAFTLDHPEDARTVTIE